jgi:PAS domain S-box-containing protein
MTRRLKVLLIEDSEDDADLIIRTLRRGGYELDHKRITTARELRDALEGQTFDVGLCDYNLPQLNGGEALSIIREIQPDIAVIFVSGIIGEEMAAELMRSGAKDYVRKDNLVRLDSAIARELAAAETSVRQRKIAEKLEFERKLLRHLMDGLPDAIYFKDVNRRYIRLNAAELKILNAGREEDAVGLPEDDFLPPERADIRRQEDERLLATGEPLADCLERFEQPDGSVLWFSENRAPLRDESGAIMGLAGIRRNVTQLKRQEVMLARSNLYLEEFAHVASHDLRSPLRAIANTVEWLGEDIGEGIAPEIQEHLDRLRLQAHRAMTLVSDLHNYSKVGRKQELEEPVDIGAMVNEIFRSLSAARCMRLAFEGEPVSIVTAKAPLDLVLRNLIDNAVKYHDRPGGYIAVRCRHQNTPTVLFEVEDDGPGIAEQHHGIVFQPFQKLESYDTVLGSGLGLATVKRTVEHFGCAISLSSPVRDGRGARFSFEWPLRIPRQLLLG